ncbi:Beta-lactamase class C-like and penicillin binding proteins (PBPs) superfamily [hydrothermal vent metagenome]|uniref:Beta-lactamase class C-like and penicillin binding proteins (PBPs) superfamily n=1 Tax=hydrothermal vent metagenome TaxID=652676 RepID=A0A3B1BQ87_9ZZZZ
MAKFLRLTGVVLFFALLVFAAIIAFNHEKASRLYGTMTLFEKENIVHNFSHMDEIFLTSPIKRSGDIFEFGTSLGELPDIFTYRGETVTSDEFLSRRATTALLVIKDDKINFEQYYQGTGADDLRISWSMAKSFTVTLFGIPVHDGLIDINASVEKYLPEMIGSGYEGVPVRDVLQMSSGVLWNEDYGDFYSDINHMGRILAIGGSLDEFTTTLVKEKPPGLEFHYVSMDTHVIGMIARRVTGKSLVQQAEDHIWSKIGMESDARWLTDSEGTAFALGGLNVTTRDYARFGRLYLNNGTWEGEQIIPAAWVKAVTSPSSAYNKPGKNKFGYGFQWWLAPDARPGEFFAGGVYGQYIYVNQPEKIVIVKNSADLNFMDERGSKHETIAFFRAIADNFHENSELENVEINEVMAE